MKKNYTYAVITVLIWSTMAAVVKKMLFNIPNLEALSISSYLAAAFLLVMNIKNGVIKELNNYSMKDYGIMSSLGFVGLFLYSALYYYGLTKLSSQEACILNYLWPMMLVVFSCIILKEKLTFMKAVAMICSFVGIIILSFGSEGSQAGGVASGIISCIVAAACYGLFSVLNKKADYNQNISMMIGWLVVGICAMAVGMPTENWVPIRGVQWIGMLWLGVVIDAVAYLLWALALKGSENTAKIANLAYLTPFLSLIVSATFLKEKIELRAFVALIFVIGGILLQNFYEYRNEIHRR
ncbi:MAG: DMT family transporter [Lachnospiraceae bacterium]|nr:DMT family transporter [Lachnospiraceae bacterium]